MEKLLNVKSNVQTQFTPPFDVMARWGLRGSATFYFEHGLCISIWPDLQLFKVYEYDGMPPRVYYINGCIDYFDSRKGHEQLLIRFDGDADFIKSIGYELKNYIAYCLSYLEVSNFQKPIITCKEIMFEHEEY